MEQLLRQSAEIMWEPQVKMFETTQRGNVKPRRWIGTPTLKYSLAHLAVRVIVVINLVHLCLSFYQPYFRATNALLRGADDSWSMISSLLLPLYCTIETFWMQRAEPSQRKALLIDWAFAITWLLVWLAFLFYAFWKYAPGL